MATSVRGTSVSRKASGRNILPSPREGEGRLERSDKQEGEGFFDSSFILSRFDARLHRNIRYFSPFNSSSNSFMCLATTFIGPVKRKCDVSSFVVTMAQITR